MRSACFWRIWIVALLRRHRTNVRAVSGCREGTPMPYHFVRSKEFVEQYKGNNPGRDSMLWIDILSEAVNASEAEVVSVGYDGIGEPVTMLLKVEVDVPAGDIRGFRE